MADYEIAAAVHRIAPMMRRDARYGTGVFISELWRTLSAEHPQIREMGLAGFKRWLIKANRDQLVELVRADLVDAMPERLVEDSEIADMGATFHFVTDRAAVQAARRPVQAPAPVPDLLSAVKNAVRTMPATGRFGNEKVFISEVWKRVAHDRDLASMGLPAFKKWLIVANRNRQVDLARADLIGAMNRDQVMESEIEDRGATFHFIIDRDARSDY
jgi:hypothetical protein